MGPERRRWQLGRNQSPLTPASLSRARRSERERGGEQEELYSQLAPPGFPESHASWSNEGVHPRFHSVATREDLALLLPSSFAPACQLGLH